MTDATQMVKAVVYVKPLARGTDTPCPLPCSYLAAFLILLSSSGCLWILGLSSAEIPALNLGNMPDTIPGFFRSLQTLN